jgi:hypothetical protein
MRGRTLNEAFIILDEAQNTTIPQMKMFLTRLGFGEGDYDNEFLMRHDLQQLEAEILMRINHFEFHGVPNRRVPDILLTQTTELRYHIQFVYPRRPFHFQVSP